jgi:hypothetical protein
MLTLAEEIFILSLHEKKNTVQIPSSISLPYVLAGAGLMQTVLCGKARVEDNYFVILPGPVPVELEWLRNPIESVHKAWGMKKLANWVYILGAKGKIISKGIVPTFLEKGILLADGKCYQWGLNGQTDANISCHTKFALKQQLRDAVFCAEAADDHTTSLLGFMDAGEMIDHIFTVDEIVSARKRIKKFTKDTHPGGTQLFDAFRAATAYAIAAAVSG